MSDESRNAQIRTSELSSWKEIAAYLGVSVRTAQYWEKRHGLPVGRLPGSRGRPLALTADLDAWKLRDSNRREIELNLQPILERESKFSYIRLQSVLGIAILLVLVTLLYGVTLRNQASAFKQARVVGGGLVAFDSEGHELWKRSFVPPLRPESYSLGWPIRELVWTGDLDGDGTNEVLFGLVTTPEHTGELICYSNDGTELWRYRPNLRLRTSVREIPNAWFPTHLAVGRTRPNGPIGIWASFLSRDSSPTMVVHLSLSGALKGTYVHAGHLHVLNLWDRGPDAGVVLLAAGINNRREMATLVVLDPENLSGASNEPGSEEEQLQGQLSPSEILRIFFPRTHLNRVLAKYNGVYGLQLARGHLEVETAEDTAQEPALALVRYTLDSKFKVVGARFHDMFGPTYRKYLAQGLVDREFDVREISALKDGCEMELGSSELRASGEIGSKSNLKARRAAGR